MLAEYPQVNADLRYLQITRRPFCNYLWEVRIGANKWDIHSLR